jgi:hypothetical protein
MMKKNIGLSLYHNFHDTHIKFYHSRKLKIYIILKNNYVYVDIMIIKYILTFFEITKKWHLIQLTLYTSFHYFYIIIFPQEVCDVGDWKTHVLFD